MLETFRGFTTRTERVTVGGRTYDLLVPADGDALLDDARVAARFEQDEYMPYWATLWPAAILLADTVAKWKPATSKSTTATVLELGCGVGLVGLVAARLGYRVTLSDHDEDALAFALENADRNNLPAPSTCRLDWRETHDGPRVDYILAADVLYETRNLKPVAEFVQRHLKADGSALLCDPNRATADPFAHVAQSCGLAVDVTPVERPGVDANVTIRGRIYDLRHGSARMG